MSGSEILTAALTAVVSVTAAIVGAINIRPKVNAEARHADTTRDVAMSDSARLWAAEFRADAVTARQRAEAAEARAEAAENRCDDLERRFNLLLLAFQQCQDELRKHPGAVVPMLPAGIEKPGVD